MLSLVRTGGRASNMEGGFANSRHRRQRSLMWVERKKWERKELRWGETKLREDHTQGGGAWEWGWEVLQMHCQGAQDPRWLLAKRKTVFFEVWSLVDQSHYPFTFVPGWFQTLWNISYIYTVFWSYPSSISTSTPPRFPLSVPLPKIAPFSQYPNEKGSGILILHSWIEAQRSQEIIAKLWLIMIF